MVKKVDNKLNHFLENISFGATKWIGTPYSLLLHTLLFAGIFILSSFGISTDKILLVLTTAVSLEAIYLAILIQMTVNRNTASLESVEDDLEDLQEDVEEISEDVEDITEEIDEDDETTQTIKDIALQLQKVQEDLALLKKRGVI